MEIFSISKNNFLTFVKSNLKVPDSSFIQPGISKRPDGAFRDLNIVENFHDHVKPSCSEHIQNWRDQCVVVFNSIKKKMLVPDATLSFCSETTDKALNILCSTMIGQDRICIGWIIHEFGDVFKPFKLIMCNTCSVIPEQALFFGGTDKRDNVSLVGNFGTGMKGEINSILRTGGNVCYYTGECSWRFGYEKGNGGNQRKLVVRFDNWEDERLNYLDQTLMFISHPTNLFEMARFLFLHNDVTSVKTEKIEILLDERHLGKIFVLGFFIETIEKLPFGLNFVDKNRVVLSDERNHHYNWKELFFEEIAILYHRKTISGENINNPVFAHLNSVIYEFLDQEQKQYSYFMMENSIIHLARELVKHFFILHGTKSVIVSKIMPISECNTISLEAKSYNLGVERVSPLLYRIMVHAEDFPSLEKLYKEFNNYFLSLPEFVSDANETLPYASIKCDKNVFLEIGLKYQHQLLEIVSTFFSPIVTPDRIRFKDFSNTSNVKRIIKATESGINYYLVDLRMFLPDDIHEEIAKDIPLFTCAQEDCDCVTEIFISTLSESFTNSEKSIINQKIRKSAMKLISKNCHTAKSYHKRNNNNNNNNNTNNNKNNNNILNSPINNNSSHKTYNNITNNINNNDQINNQNNPHFKQVLKSESIITSIKSVTHNCLTGTQAITENQLDCSSRQRIEDTNIQQREFFSYECVEQPNSTIVFHHTDEIFNIKIYHSNNLPPLYEPPREIESKFSSIIFVLANSVFLVPLDHVAIVYEDSNRIAFNRGGSIFNMKYFLSLQEDDLNRTFNAQMEFWYSVFCHELAHNTSKNHDQLHVFSMGILVHHHLRAFRDTLNNNEKELLFDAEHNNFFRTLWSFTI